MNWFALDECELEELDFPPAQSWSLQATNSGDIEISRMDFEVAWDSGCVFQEATVESAGVWATPDDSEAISTLELDGESLLTLDETIEIPAGVLDNLFASPSGVFGID